MTQYLSPWDCQRINESMYARAHIDGYIRRELHGNPEIQQKMNEGERRIQAFLDESYYDSKNQRLDQIRHLKIPQLVEDIFVGVAYCLQPQLFTTVSAQLAGRLGMSDRREAIHTVAELLAVLCLTDAFDIFKMERSDSLQVISRIPLSQQLLQYIAHSEYLPPMVCAPKVVRHNRESGYLTLGADSLILGKGNHHEGDICLDVINILNQQKLKLATDFISTVELEPTYELDSPEKAQLWQQFKGQAYHFMDLLVHQGNQVYFTHKVDKRGRIYCQAYHVNYQGTSWQKAALELADEEVVEGVPTPRSSL